MNQTEDFIPFSFQDTVGFLDSIEDCSNTSGPANDSFGGFGGDAEDWAQTYVTLDEDFSFNDLSPESSDLSLGLHSNDSNSASSNATTKSPNKAGSLTVPADNVGTSSSSLSPVANWSDSEVTNHKRSVFPDLPTPPPNYVNAPITSIEKNYSPNEESPSALSSDSSNYTTQRNIKQESVSPSRSIDLSPSASGPTAPKSMRNVKPAKSSSKVTKPRKEKTSHNMIEKRYRTNINDKISALRECVPALRCALNGEANEDLEGLSPASKLNKATVLTKATEYIQHLQHKNGLLEKKVQELQVRLASVTNPMDISSGGSSASVYSVANSVPPTHATQYNAYPPQPAPYELKGRLLMGSLAGLAMTGMYTDMGNSDTQSLSAVPLFGLNINAFGIVRIALLATTFLYIVSPLFMTPPPKSHKTKKFDIFTTTKMRKQVWEVTSKSLGAIPEGGASTVKSLASIFYALAGGMFSMEQSSELSWSRAVDAQLCGGDEEINKSRLLFSLARTMNMVPSAKRYILQAIQIKVLLHGYPSLARYFSTASWKKAMEYPSELTKNQIALLKSNVLEEADVMQRMYNLTMQQPLNKDVAVYDEDAVISVIRDQSIRSAIDIMAGWYATKLLHGALLSCVENQELDLMAIEKAASIAPVDSAVQQRVAVVQALFMGAKNPQTIRRAMDLISQDAFAEEEQVNSDCPPLVNERRTIPQDMQLAIHCSFVLSFLERDPASAIKLVQRLEVSSAEDISLLGFTAIWLTVTALGASEECKKDLDCRFALENLATSARVWIGSEPGENQGVRLERRRELVGQCLKLSVEFGQFKNDLDEGYCSA